MALILMAIGGYPINGYWWLLMAISGYFINGYQWILVTILLVAIDGYSIGDYYRLYYDYLY